MSSELKADTEAGREERYVSLIPQVKGLMEGEEDVVANLANICAVLKSSFGFFWVGFYRVKGDQLVLGPFQGPVACVRIERGQGVCGKAWERNETQVVGDVNQFPGHIACSPESRSEIVVPVRVDQKVAYVLDIDSTELNGFDETDKQYLELIMGLLEESLTPSITRTIN